MDFHQLESLLALAETCSFTRAAQRVHVVQSTLSQQIQSLEKEMGVQLFVRTTRKVSLTPAGKQAVDYARQLLKLRDEFLHEMQQETSREYGTVHIGSEQVAANYDLVSLLEGFQNDYPRIEVILQDVISGRELDLMMSLGQLDLCLINDIEGYPRLSGVALYHDELVVAMNRNHPLAARSRIDWIDLLHQPLVIPSSNEMLEKKILAKCAKYGFEPQIVYRTSNLQISADLLKKNYLSLNSGHAAQIRFRDAAICRMNDPIPRQITLAHNSGKTPSAAAMTFLKYAEAHKKS